MDNKGYIIGGMAFLLIIPAVIMLISLIHMVNMDETMNTPIKSERLHHISVDVESNIPILTLQALDEKSEMAIKTGQPISNSKVTIKMCIQSKIDYLAHEYSKNTGLNINCKINAVDNSLDPFQICVNSTIDVHSNNISIIRNISQNVPFSCSDHVDSTTQSYKIKDPLPFIKTRGYGVLEVNGDRIYYGTTLSNYLKAVGLNNTEVYENATSPLYFKKCPYEPYISHVNSKDFSNLKNCIDNGYYHESNDGSCIFCRLEGRATCKHYGLETFILPSRSPEQVLTAPCSVDHVIFGETIHNPVETYPGTILEYYSNTNVSNILYLDNGHRKKYGVLLK